MSHSKGTQSTVIPVSPEMLIGTVFGRFCQNLGLVQNDYVLRLAGTTTIASLEHPIRALEGNNILDLIPKTLFKTEFSIVSKQMINSALETPNIDNFIDFDNFSSSYQRFTVWRRYGMSRLGGLWSWTVIFSISCYQNTKPFSNLPKLARFL